MTIPINNRIFTFPNGAKLDLRRVVCIGALDKNINTGTFFIPVHVTGRNTPIDFNVGFAIGKADETKKTFIMQVIEELTMAWYTYLTLREEENKK